MSSEIGAEPVSEALTLTVPPEASGERVDSYLAARVEGVSRTALKRLVEDGDVLVDEQIVKPSHKLRGGERIEIEFAAPPPLNLAPEDIPLDIVYEDDELIVVNKPAGMVVHPGAGVSSGTLANALVNYFQHLSQRAGPARPGIVHRLDRDTSGLLVVAKTEAAHEHLAAQFRAREVFKAYVALVHGRVAAAASGRIEKSIGRDPARRTRMAVVAGGGRGGRDALTLYRVRRRFDWFTLLDVEIKTGRTHQIRVHLAWLKHPVVGDEVYGAGRDRNLPDARTRLLIGGLDRHFLHAGRLELRHPRTGETIRFDAPLPRVLSDFLDELERMEEARRRGGGGDAAAGE